jgi:hypothetical protein
MHPDQSAQSEVKMQLNQWRLTLSGHTCGAFSTSCWRKRGLPGQLHHRLLEGLVIRLTRPSFCTTESERVYSTTSDGSGFANGGSQGAEGDRRAGSISNEQKREDNPPPTTRGRIT